MADPHFDVLIVGAGLSGIRSDSDMFTLGYSFRPRTEAKSIADGPAILAYVQDTAREAGIEPHIRFNHMVETASWDSTTARWTIEASTNGVPTRRTGPPTSTTPASASSSSAAAPPP